MYLFASSVLCTRVVASRHRHYRLPRGLVHRPPRRKEGSEDSEVGEGDPLQTRNRRPMRCNGDTNRYDRAYRVAAVALLMLTAGTNVNFVSFSYRCLPWRLASGRLFYLSHVLLEIYKLSSRYQVRSVPSTTSSRSGSG